MTSMPYLDVSSSIFLKNILTFILLVAIIYLKISTHFSIISRWQQITLSIISKFIITLSWLVSSERCYMYFWAIFRVLQYGIMKSLLFPRVVSRLVLFFLSIHSFVNNQATKYNYQSSVVFKKQQTRWIEAVDCKWSMMQQCQNKICMPCYGMWLARN